MERGFRECVLAVFTNAKGEVLIAERADETEAWQMPQGGVDAGETAEEALFREMGEEIGCQNFKVIARSESPIRYHFPEGLKTAITKRYRGQDQIWFHVKFAEGAGPDLKKATDKEFKSIRWATATECLRLAVPFKKDAYRKGFEILGIEFKD